ncbi:MAG: L,D-transpeptidase family protein [Hyphomicrobiaceae bacterium]
MLRVEVAPPFRGADGDAMKFGKRTSILATNALIAVAGVAAMAALVRLMNVDTAKPRPSESAYMPLPAVQPSAKRWAFAPPDVFPRDGDTSRPTLRPASFPDGDELSEGPEDAPDDETANWSTETLLAPWQTDLRSAPDQVRPQRPSRDRPLSTSLKKKLAEISPGARIRLEKKFENAKAPWPPAEIALIGIKDEKVLELHARAKAGRWMLVHRYRILAASGHAGPKLLQGDRQVPEGLYRISFLNPNSAYHVSLRVNYPNAFDRKMAAKEGRKNLGGDIMIHGKNLSAGCLAMGDEAVEEIFVLAAETGLSKVRLIIAPTDLRKNPTPAAKPSQPDWVPKLYTEIASAMSGFETATPVATSSVSAGFGGIMALFGK